MTYVAVASVTSLKLYFGKNGLVFLQEISTNTHPVIEVSIMGVTRGAGLRVKLPAES